MEIIQNNLNNSNLEIGKKRKKLSGDERLKRNRERNKLHARKTRERKKNQSIALQTRINELKDEGKRLRLMVDERYISSSLLGLGQLSFEKTGDVITLQLSSSICNDYYSTVFSEKPFGGEANEHSSKIGRVRRSGKYTPQEREKTRRERNRVHAKKTRDKKKNLLEISEKLITEMENESRLLRSYLFKLNLVSEDEILTSQLRENESKLQLENYKMYNCEEEDEEEDDDDNSSVSSNEIENNHEDLVIKEIEIPIPSDKSHKQDHNNLNAIVSVSFVDDDPNDSVAGSDDPNEKNSNWSGSNDDSHSSNHDSSLTGGTSRDEHSSNSSNQSNNLHDKYNNRNNNNLNKKQIDNNHIKSNHQINDTQMISFSFNHKRYDNVNNSNDCNLNVSNDCNIDMKDGIEIYQQPYHTNLHALEITSSDMKKRKFHLENNKQKIKNSKSNFISKPSFNSNEVSNNNSSSNCHTNKEMLTNTNPNSSGSGTSSNGGNWITDPKNGTKVTNNSSSTMSLDSEAVAAIALGCLPIDAVLRPRTQS